MTRQTHRETNESGESNESDGSSERTESAWTALRAAIEPRRTDATTEGRSMDERTAASLGPEPDVVRPREGGETLLDASVFAERDRWRTADGGRFVVSVDEDGTAESRPLSDGGTSPGERGRYTVDVTAKTEHGVASHSVASNDVSETFEELLRWYASRVAPGEDPAEVIDLLLASTDLR